MPPRVGSRHTFTLRRIATDGSRYLTEREPYTFRELSDNRTHTARQGDSWFTIAARYFAGVPRACGFFWAICDFQPDPVVDPTIPPELGRVVVIPSISTLSNKILGEQRRRDHG